MKRATADLFGARQSHPNAALDLANDRELAGVVALQLSHPSYNAATKVLSYRVERLPSLDTGGLAHLEAQRTRAALPRRFHAASLFIDDAPVAAPDTLVSRCQGTAVNNMQAPAGHQYIIVPMPQEAEPGWILGGWKMPGTSAGQGGSVSWSYTGTVDGSCQPEMPTTVYLDDANTTLGEIFLIVSGNSASPSRVGNPIPDTVAVRIDTQFVDGVAQTTFTYTNGPSAG